MCTSELDLEKDLDTTLHNKFDVCFNHTTLEHIYEFQKAFQNICLMSKDIVIIVLPFLQEQHADYGDYWRFTPMAIRQMFERNAMEMIYVNYNDEPNESIYIFAIGRKRHDKWNEILIHKDNKIDQVDKIHIGKKIIKNSFLYEFIVNIKVFIATLIKRK